MVPTGPPGHSRAEDGSGPGRTILGVRDETLIVIDTGPDGRPRKRSPLEGRRLAAIGILALVEVIALAVWRPGVLVGSLLALAVLALAVAGIVRTRPGLGSLFCGRV